MRSRCALTKAPGQPGNLNVTKSNPRYDVRHCSRAWCGLTRFARLDYGAFEWSSDGSTGGDGGPLGELLPPSCPMWPNSRDRLQAQTYVKRFPYKPPTQRSGEARSSSNLLLNTAGGRDASAVLPSPTDIATPLTPVGLYLPYPLPSASPSNFEVPSPLDSLPHSQPWLCSYIVCAPYVAFDACCSSIPGLFMAHGTPLEATSTAHYTTFHGPVGGEDPECKCEKKQKCEVEERQMGRGGSLKTLKREGCVNNDAWWWWVAPVLRRVNDIVSSNHPK